MRAKTICEAGGDWEHKNKLKVCVEGGEGWRYFFGWPLPLWLCGSEAQEQHATNTSAIPQSAVAAGLEHHHSFGLCMHMRMQQADAAVVACYVPQWLLLLLCVCV